MPTRSLRLAGARGTLLLWSSSLRVAVLFLLCACGSCSEPTSSTWLSWNVQNLFDALDDPDTFDDVLQPVELAAKLEAIGIVLRELDPDVVLLQEVEHRALLDRLADQTLGDLGYAHRALVEGNDPRGIDVAVLSRWPLRRVISHRDARFPLAQTDSTDLGSTSFSRDALEVWVDVDGEIVCVFVLHLRSQIGGSAADEKRLAEARYVRELVELRAAAGVEQILVAGDFNDVPSSATLATLIDGGPLVDLTAAVRPPDRWTYRFEGDLLQLDYVLASGPLANALLPGTSTIAHGPAIDHASDHAPVSVRLRH